MDLKRRHATHELARVCGQLERVRLVPDPFRRVVEVPRHAERPRQQFVARSLPDRVRLPRQERLVDLPRPPRYRPVRHHLVPRQEVHDVPPHDLLRRDLALLAAPHHPRPRRRQRHQRPQRSYRMQLLVRRDDHVREHHRPHEQPVPELPHRQQRHDHRQQDHVEERQRVRPHHVPVRALPRRIDVPLPRLQPPRRLRLRQPHARTQLLAHTDRRARHVLKGKRSGPLIPHCLQKVTVVVAYGCDGPHLQLPPCSPEAPRPRTL